jgi:hypothetical protein
MDYQPRGTRTKRRLREFREASRVRRAVALAGLLGPTHPLSTPGKAEPFSVVAALLAMSEEERRD